MKRTISAVGGKTKIRLPKEAARLVSLCEAAIAAGSRVEEQFWIGQADELAALLMDRGNDAAIESALGHTHKLNTPVHDVLAATCEAAAEACLLITNTATADRAPRQALLISIPLVVWSKYQIPAGPLTKRTMAPISSHLHGHILGPDVSLCVNPFLYSIDQLPRGFADTRKLLKLMATAAEQKLPALIDYSNLAETAALPADVRFILAAVVVNQGNALFQWQETDGPDSTPTHQSCHEQWNKQTRPLLAAILPGCEFECGLPNAFFNNCRESDLLVRPRTLASVIDGTATMLDLPATSMAAVIAGVGDGQIDEYRVSLTRKNQNEVVNGVVWPLYGEEDDDTNPGPRQTIETLLKQHHLSEITLLDGVRPPEFCDDCGAPLFYNHDGEAVHAEMPEDVDHPSTHYH